MVENDNIIMRIVPVILVTMMMEGLGIMVPKIMFTTRTVIINAMMRTVETTE